MKVEKVVVCVCGGKTSSFSSSSLLSGEPSVTMISQIGRLVVLAVLINICFGDSQLNATSETEETNEIQNTPATIVLITSDTTSTTTAPSAGDIVNITTSTIRPTTQAIPTTTARRSPCKCADGACLCCTGYLLNRLNITTRNKACMKVEYEPDDFEFNFKLLFNDRKIYQNKVSGKNPQPICLPIRRIVNINACVKFSNVYVIRRNLHACIDFEGDWNDFELFSVSFECFRIGADGVAVVKPEEGGGLPVPTHKPSNLGPLDYDDSA